MSALGKRINILRVMSRIWSLRGFAKKVDISPAFLSDIEHGNRYPSDPVLKRIAKQLKVTFRSLKSLDTRRGTIRTAERIRTLKEAVKRVEAKLDTRETINYGLQAAIRELNAMVAEANGVE